MSPGMGMFLWPLLFAVFGAIFSAIRSEDRRAAFGGNLVVGFLVLLLIDSLSFHFGRPTMTFSGLLPLILVNLFVMLIISIVVDIAADGIGAGWPVTLVVLVVFGISWIVVHNGGHSAQKASHIVSVSVEPGDALPASSTSHMVVVSDDIATTKAQQAMSSGTAGKRNYNTYLNLGPADLQMVDGHMWYVFPLEFDGAGNKARLHGIMPGYVMIDAENPNANPVEHYDNQYSMVVGLGAGQGAEPDRWAYDHGYTDGLLDDPTLELDESGKPYYTVTVLKPHLGSTFFAPSEVLVIDAHTGKITPYALNKVPSWIDRVYSQNMASTIANWYGQYAQAGFQGVGSSNANRFRVSGNPVLVYTGDGNPDWRMLLTSYNNDSSVSKIVIMDAHSGAMRLYSPQEPMGVEEPVIQAFNNASGQGASMVKANHYQAVGLTLHLIYGHVTWMATYESEGSHPSFVGVGFVDAYHASANNVVFGDSKSAALQNYLTQLASQPTANGNAPGAGSQTQTISGKIAAVNWDITGGQKYWYISLIGDDQHVYVGTEVSLGPVPAVVLAKPGDSVTITVLNVGVQSSSRTMESFTDTAVPLKPAGS